MHPKKWDISMLIFRLAIINEKICYWQLFSSLWTIKGWIICLIIFRVYFILRNSQSIVGLPQNSVNTVMVVLFSVLLIISLAGGLTAFFIIKKKKEKEGAMETETELS